MHSAKWGLSGDISGSRGKLLPESSGDYPVKIVPACDDMSFKNGFVRLPNTGMSMSSQL